MDINSIVAAIGTHNWLLLVMIVAVYARTLFGPNSKFPVTLSPNWLPVFSGLAGAVVTGDTALMGGKAIGAAVLLAIVGFVSGGFADGMIVAIFGDATKAPRWARALIFLVDQVFGGGGGASVKQTQTDTRTTETVVQMKTPAAPPPTASSRTWAKRSLGLALAVGAVIVGCANGTLNPQVLNVSVLSLETLTCGLTTYARDTTTSPVNWGQLALDLAANCGMDVADIVNAFGATSPVAQAATSNAAAVHTAATTFKAKMAGH